MKIYHFRNGVMLGDQKSDRVVLIFHGLWIHPINCCQPPPLSSRLLAYSSILTSMNARLSSLNEIQAGVLGKVAACKAPAKPQTF